MKPLAFLILSSLSAYATPLSVTLESNLPSPQPVGTVIGLLPRLAMAPPALYVYRYSVSTNGSPFRIIRDFSQDPQITWTPDLYEHQARVRVTVRNNATKETADCELPFRITPRNTDADGIATPTANPLIALFSAAPCPVNSHFRVAFRPKGTDAIARTSAEPCRGNITSNVYVAGMYAATDYEMRFEASSDATDTITGKWIPFRTGLLDGRFPHIGKGTRLNENYHPAEGLIIRSIIDFANVIEFWRPTATDLDGNIVWYLSPESTSFLTRVLDGGHFLTLADGANSVNRMKRLQAVRELDLLGHTLRETNISRLAEQLESHGIQSDCKLGSQQCIPGFHHEAVRLPNGHTLVIAGLERMFPAGTQGSKAPVDVLGDLIFDLDEDFQLAWFWNSFDHMDLKRASLSDEKCKGGPGDDGCTPVFLAADANGWLHSNALNYLPSTGDLLLSIPEQDWVIKIDYRDGKGSGKVLWRLGKGGDFTTNSTDPYPWFSYQHDVGIDPDSHLLVLLDDGRRRKSKFPQANNRGQAWNIDEAAHTATLVYNADLGIFSIAVGSAQKLTNGGYSFESGLVDPSPAGIAAVYSQTTDTSADGKITYTQRTDGALTYRSFRVPDMYTAPRK